MSNDASTRKQISNSIEDTLESHIQNLYEKDNTVYSLLLDENEQPINKLDAYTKNEIARVAKLDDEKQVKLIEDCELAAAESLAKMQSTSARLSNGTVNRNVFKKVERLMSEAMDELIKADMDCLDTFSSQSTVFYNKQSNIDSQQLGLNSTKTMDCRDIYTRIASLQYGAAITKESLPKGSQRVSDLHFVNDLIHIWSKHVGKPKTKNKRLESFVELMLPKGGVFKTDPKNLITKALNNNSK